MDFLDRNSIFVCFILLILIKAIIRLQNSYKFNYFKLENLGY